MLSPFSGRPGVGRATAYSGGIMQHRFIGVRLSAIFFVCFAILGVTSRNAQGQSRLPAIPPEKMTEAQKKAAAEYKASRNATLTGGPYGIMLRTPEMLTRWHQIGMYLNSFDCKSLPGGRYRGTDQ